MAHWHRFRGMTYWRWLGVGVASIWAACSLPLLEGVDDGGGGTDAGFDQTRDDAGSSNRDGGGSGDRGSTVGDGGDVLPDVQAADEGYLISSQSGDPGTASQLPAGDPQSDVYIDPFAGNTTFIPGGTNRFTGTVQGGPVNSLVIGFQELGGAYEIELSAADFVFFATLGQDVRRASLTLVIVPRIAPSESNPQGGFGQALRVPCTVQQVGTGDLQISLSWDTESDVDLHLIEPDSEEIFYGEMRSDDGGELDLDSNAGCDIDHVKNENITYQGAVPEQGHYIVRVDYWAACEAAGTTNFVVTVTIRGEAQVFEGSFVRSDQDHGDYGAGVTVAEFDF